MKYLLINIETLKLYSCSNCEDVIRQVRYEKTEALEEVEMPLENIIFNPKLFNTSEKLAKLKQVLGSFISNHPAKDEKKIDGHQKNQFFCIYAALWSRSYVLAKTGLADFVRQMALWFPEWVPTDVDKKNFKNFNNALSTELAHWKDENGLVKVGDWKKFAKDSSMRVSKVAVFANLAQEIYLAVNALVKSMQDEQNG
jgi:hypothetical protein